MTESEWLACQDPQKLLEFLRGKASDRKLRLFVCACCRRIWELLDDEALRAAIDVSERYADQKASGEELLAAAAAVQDLFHTGEVSDDWTGASLFAANVSLDSDTGDYACERATAGFHLANAINAASSAANSFADDVAVKGGADYRSEAWEEAFNDAEVAERLRQVGLLRHVIGNPFSPYPAPPSWPSTVVKQAEALYAGEDCSFALHDALLEAGHPELAEHFRGKEHPKGCWVVDLLLGKE